MTDYYQSLIPRILYCV